MTKSSSTLNANGGKYWRNSNLISDACKITSLKIPQREESITIDNSLLQIVFSSLLIEEGIAVDDICTCARNIILNDVQC
jgi:hypothetical protein